jgi:flavin-dependent dehydrogenase
VYDLVVVGARCAGAATALLAARAGERVLMLDRAAFPSDTLSTSLIHQPGVALLARWGVLDEVVATGCPAIRRASFHIADVHLRGTSDAADGQRAAYAPRRYLLDRILADAAVAAGAEFRERSRVVGLLGDGDAVAGVRYRTADGESHEVRARLVVGADGMRSDVARLVGAPKVVDDGTSTVVYYSFWQGLPAEYALHEAPGRFAGLIPTNDDRVIVAAYFPQAEFGTVRRDARTAYLAHLRTLVPDIRDAEHAETRFERLHGLGDQQNFFRKACGPGWVLLGDAGHHKDSITARGITDAFVQVQLFDRLVLPYLRDSKELSRGLREFEAARDERLAESYYNTLSVARLEVGDDRVRLLRTMARDQSLINAYFSVVSGTRSVEDVYTAELIEQAGPAVGS